MKPELLFIAYPLSILLALLGWLFLPSRSRLLFLIPSLIPLSLLVFILASGLPQGEELAIPFIKIPGGLLLEIRLKVAQLQVFLAFLVSFLSFLIQFYALNYLEKKDSRGYFHFLMACFQLSMAGLFLSVSLFSLFIFWELIGLISYLLVQFWFQRPAVTSEALKVLLINKAGDVLLLSGIGLLLSFGLGFSVSFNLNFPEGADVFLASPAGLVLCSFLMVSAAVKSAQFPFSVWLKKAMAGPAPVSALLHSATMVVAGVWLMSRLGPYMPEAILRVLGFVGLFSYLVANLAAIGSDRLKSTLAFSTMAQLGLMMAAIGNGAFDPVVFHLIAHAFYKAGLFLLCGWLMHILSDKGFKGDDNQTYANLRGILSASPVLALCSGILLAALAGVPLSSGFISKEGLMPQPWQSGAAYDWLLFAGMQAGSFLTAMYAGRIFYVLCLGENKEPLPFSFGFAVPVLLCALASGFWLFGLNPLSSEGWLAVLTGLNGEAVRPDFIAVLLGFISFWFLRNYSVFNHYPAYLKSIFMDFRPMDFLAGFAWRRLISLSGLVKKSDEKVIDRSLRIGSKAVVVAGYFSSFTDRHLLDGFLRFCGSFFYSIGGILFMQARQSARFAVWLAVLVLILIIYFSYYL